MTQALVISPAEALGAIAKDPESKHLTPTKLREAAQGYEREAHRKDRLTVSRTHGNRRNARAFAARQQAERLRLHAQVVRSAADEIEERGASTVGEAARGRLKFWRGIAAVLKHMRQNQGNETQSQNFMDTTGAK